MNFDLGSAWDSIKEGTKETQIDFIRGYFDCESYISNTRGIEVASASKELIYYVRLMLKNLGIQSSVYQKHVRKYPDKTYYRLQISKANAVQYIHIIGTKSEKVKERYNEFLNIYKNTFASIVPNIKKMCIQLLHIIIDP